MPNFSTISTVGGQYGVPVDDLYVILSIRSVTCRLMCCSSNLCSSNHFAA